MAESQDKKEEKSIAPVKKPYQKPVLKKYKSIKKLIASVGISEI